MASLTKVAAGVGLATHLAGDLGLISFRRRSSGASKTCLPTKSTTSRAELWTATPARWKANSLGSGASQLIYAPIIPRSQRLHSPYLSLTCKSPGGIYGGILTLLNKTEGYGVGIEMACFTSEKCWCPGRESNPHAFTGKGF